MKHFVVDYCHTTRVLVVFSPKVPEFITANLGQNENCFFIELQAYWYGKKEWGNTDDTRPGLGALISITTAPDWPLVLGAFAQAVKKIGEILQPQSRVEVVLFIWDEWVTIKNVES